MTDITPMPRSRLRRVIAVLVAAHCNLLGLFATVTLSTTTARAEVAVQWELDNPFRLFTDPRDTEVHRATYRALPPSQQRNSPVQSSELALQARHRDGWAVSMYRKTCWNWSANTFTCSDYDDYINPKSHRVRAKVTGIEDAALLTCTWLTAPKGPKQLRGKAIEQSCTEAVQLDVSYPDGADLSVEVGGIEIAKAEIRVTDILVMGMGDSFASGEGNPDVPVRFSRERAADYGASKERPDLAGYPARVGNWNQIGDDAFIAENPRWMDQACHRSLYSQQLRAALQLAVEDPHRAVTFVGLACSGAEVTSGLFLRYKGHEWVPNPPLLSQISAAADAQCGNRPAEPQDLPEAYHIKRQIPDLVGGLVLHKCPVEQSRKIDLVLLSIGGNDVGFARLVANAVLSNQSTLRKLGGWIGQVEGQSLGADRLRELEARYKSLSRALHNILHMPWDQNDRVILTAYPGLALTGDGSETCPDGNSGMEIVPDFQLSEQKLREGAWTADKLHRTMRQSAYKQGWTFVETHRRKFIGRGICSGGSGPRVGNDELRLPRKIDGAWVPYNPADYNPYAARRRLFRTPNDAFMTGNFHVASSLLLKALKFESLASFQLLLASTYSGSFHPTAEGHAVIADAVAAKARSVLRKYGQASDRDYNGGDAMAPVTPEPFVALPDVDKVLRSQDVISNPPPLTPLPPQPQVDQTGIQSEDGRGAVRNDPESGSVSSSSPQYGPGEDRQR